MSTEEGVERKDKVSTLVMVGFIFLGSVSLYQPQWTTLELCTIHQDLGYTCITYRKRGGS